MNLHVQRKMSRFRMLLQQSRFIYHFKQSSLKTPSIVKIEEGESKLKRLQSWSTILWAVTMVWFVVIDVRTQNISLECILFGSSKEKNASLVMNVFNIRQWIASIGSTNEQEDLEEDRERKAYCRKTKEDTLSGGSYPFPLTSKGGEIRKERSEAWRQEEQQSQGE